MKFTDKQIMPIKTIIFDFGGVLIDWNPHYLYRKIFDDEQEMLWFLENICTSEWNLKLDTGYPFGKAVKELQKQFPEYKIPIQAYHERWQEMLGGEISQSVDILYELKEQKYPTYGLTNWSTETFPIAYDRFDFLKKLDGIVVSGEEKLVKPNPELYNVLIDRYDVKPDESVFIDDKLINVEGARKIGFKGIHFTSPENLRKEFIKMGVL